jgi:multidrug resistance efflux pump
MIAAKVRLVSLTSIPLFVLIALSAGYWSIASPRLGAQESAPPVTKGSKVKELLKERLATLRELVKLETLVYYKAGAGSYDQVHEAARMLLQAELEQCDSDKERVALLEKFVAEVKKQEQLAVQLNKAGRGPTGTALKAKADRLQAEIALERARAKLAAGPGDGKTAQESHGQVALAEKQVAIKRAALKVAEAQTKLAAATLTRSKVQVAEAEATESFRAKELKRFEQLVTQGAVTTALADERRAWWEAAKAHRSAAKGKLVEYESQVLLEQARVGLAQLEVEDAVLRLKQLKATLEPKR